MNLIAIDVVVRVGGREAIPVRALPFVTGNLLPADDVAFQLAHQSQDESYKSMSAYHLGADGQFVRMLPRDWDEIAATFRVFHMEADRLEEADANLPAAYGEYRRQAPKLLPSGVFVWKDEFEQAYLRATSAAHLTIHEERTGDRERNFRPLVPEGLAYAVMEGWNSPVMNLGAQPKYGDRDAAGGKQSARARAREQLVIQARQIDPEFQMTWRQLFNDPRMRDSLREAGINSVDTLRKALGAHVPRRTTGRPKAEK